MASIEPPSPPSPSSDSDVGGRMDRSQQSKGSTSHYKPKHKGRQTFVEKIHDLQFSLEMEKQKYLQLLKKNQDDEKALEEYKRENAMLRGRVYQLEETRLRYRNGEVYGAQEEGAAKRASGGHIGDWISGKERSAASSVDEDSSDTDSDYDDQPIPDELKKDLAKLCEEHGVKHYLFYQNPADFQDILLEGVTVSNIRSADLSALHKKWEGYTIQLKEEDRKEEVRQCMYAEVEGTPTAPLRGLCQLVVEKPSEGMMETFAVFSAHVMFSEQENIQLKGGQGIEKAYNHIMRKPAHTMFSIRYQTSEGEERVFEAQNPSEIRYRYKINRELQPEDVISLPQPANPKDSERKVDPNECLNDLVLFRLKYSDGEKMAQSLRRGQKMRNMVKIDYYNTLKKYVRHSSQTTIRIKVKEFEGVLEKHPLDIDQQRANGDALYISFTLNDGSLGPGDSGSVVYKINKDQSLSSLGLYTGILHQRYPEREQLYQAAILCKALEDIDRNLRPFNESFKDRTEDGQITS